MKNKADEIDVMRKIIAVALTERTGAQDAGKPVSREIAALVERVKIAGLHLRAVTRNRSNGAGARRHLDLAHKELTAVLLALGITISIEADLRTLN